MADNFPNRTPLDYAQLQDPMHDVGRDIRAAVAMAALLMLLAFALGFLVGWSV